jgi:type III restriction enzyme
VQQEFPLIDSLPYNQFKITEKISKNDLPFNIELDKDNTLFFKPETTIEDINKVCEKLKPLEAEGVKQKYTYFVKINLEQTPATKGEKICVPRLMFENDGEMLFADPETIFENFDWDIKEYDSCELTQNEFDIQEMPGKGFFIDIDGNSLKYSEAGKDQLLPYMADVDVWTNNNLVHWLDIQLKQDDIPQSSMVFWLRMIIDHIAEKRKIPITKLMIAKFALLNKLRTKIISARSKAKAKSFEMFKEKGRKEINFEKTVNFTAGMYDGIPVYQGSYNFKKHFLGSKKVPAFDGKQDGEEFKCAQAIDSCEDVKYWVRNVERHSLSFKLPISNGNFYPDFVAVLNDGRILIVEYKGKHLLDNLDTKEKVLIGEMWEKAMSKNGLFILAVQDKDGKDIASQIKERIGK